MPRTILIQHSPDEFHTKTSRWQSTENIETNACSPPTRKRKRSIIHDDLSERRNCVPELNVDSYVDSIKTGELMREENVSQAQHDSPICLATPEPLGSQANLVESTKSLDMTLWYPEVSASSPASAPPSPYPTPISALSLAERSKLQAQRYWISGRGPPSHVGVELDLMEQGLLNLRNSIYDNIQTGVAQDATCWRSSNSIVSDFAGARSLLGAGKHTEAMVLYDQVLASVVQASKSPDVALFQLISHIFSWATYPDYGPLVQALLLFFARLKSEQQNPIFSLTARALLAKDASARPTMTAFLQCIADCLELKLGPHSLVVLWLKLRLSRHKYALKEHEAAWALLKQIQDVHSQFEDYMEPFVKSELDRELGVTLQLFGDYFSAKRYLERTLKYYIAGGRKYEHRRVYFQQRLATCNMQLGDYEEALAQATGTMHDLGQIHSMMNTRVCAARDLILEVQAKLGRDRNPSSQWDMRASSLVTQHESVCSACMPSKLLFSSYELFDSFKATTHVQGSSTWVDAVREFTKESGVEPSQNDLGFSHAAPKDGRKSSTAPSDFRCLETYENIPSSEASGRRDIASGQNAEIMPLVNSSYASVPAESWFANDPAQLITQTAPRMSSPSRYRSGQATREKFVDCSCLSIPIETWSAANPTLQMQQQKSPVISALGTRVDEARDQNQTQSPPSSAIMGSWFARDPEHPLIHMQSNYNNLGLGPIPIESHSVDDTDRDLLTFTGFGHAGPEQVRPMCRVNRAASAGQKAKTSMAPPGADADCDERQFTRLAQTSSHSSDGAGTGELCGRYSSHPLALQCQLVPEIRPALQNPSLSPQFEVKLRVTPHEGNISKQAVKVDSSASSTPLESSSLRLV